MLIHAMRDSAIYARYAMLSPLAMRHDSAAAPAASLLPRLIRRYVVTPHAAAAYTLLMPLFSPCRAYVTKQRVY